MSPTEKTELDQNTGEKPGLRAWWTLGVVAFVSLIDWADRSVIGIVIEPIRKEFGFSDTEMGLLAGIAFTILYVVAGIFFGRIADRWNRRNLLVGVLTFWSSMTLMFGLAKNFAHLFVARVGIGAGTGGTNPTAISIVSDIFPASNRGLAMGIYQVGGVIGFSLGIYLGGAMTQQYGWRATMIGFGLFGLAVAVLILLVIDEPIRRTRAPDSATSDSSPPMHSVFGFMWSQKSLLHFAMGSGLLMFTEGVGNVWTIPYFQRSFNMELAEASSLISVLWLVAGLIGALTGGFFMDWLFRKRPKWVMKLLIGVALTMAILSLPLYLSESRTVALTALFLHTTIYSLTFSAFLAIPVALLKNRMRATGYAITAFARYLFSGLGPLWVGMVSDSINPDVGDESLRYAMLSSGLFLFWAAAHFHLGSRTFENDFTRADGV